MFMEGDLIGFLFFDSYQKGAFSEELVHYLDLFGHLVSLVIINELTASTRCRTVSGAQLHHLRDVETLPLDRMGATPHHRHELARKFGFDDEFIEHVFLFARSMTRQIGCPTRC